MLLTKSRVTLSQEAINDLQWWIDSAHLNNGRDIIPPPVDTMIFLRCLKNRMGHLSRFNPDRGKMVKKRSQFPHKFSGTKSSIPSFSGCRSISQGAPHLFWHRQLHSHVSNKQARGHSVSKTAKSSNRIMELCPERKPDNLSHPHSREAECPGRSQIKNFQ